MLRRIPVAVLACLVGGWATAGALDLSAYRGQVVYLDFWASWCGPCRESFPWLGYMTQQYGNRRFVVIGVNVDHDRPKAERFLAGTPASFPIVYDPTGDIATSFRVSAMPSAILLDRNGRVRYQHSGFTAARAGEYEDEVEKLLDEK